MNSVKKSGRNQFEDSPTFSKPHPRPVQDKKDLFLEDRLINRTLREKMLEVNPN
jgi:hypothetical protein